MTTSDKVVCVDDSPCACTGQRHLALNKVYVVEGVDPNWHGLYLVGVPNFIDEDGELLGWRATRFRLLADCRAAAAAAAQAKPQPQSK